jgi:hypothetical protein
MGMRHGVPAGQWVFVYYYAAASVSGEDHAPSRLHHQHDLLRVVEFRKGAYRKQSYSWNGKHHLEERGRPPQCLLG